MVELEEIAKIVHSHKVYHLGPLGVASRRELSLSLDPALDPLWLAGAHEMEPLYTCTLTSRH